MVILISISIAVILGLLVYAFGMPSMNKFVWLFTGAFITFLSAWLGLVVAPYAQLGQLEQHKTEFGDLLPPQPSGLALEGERVYAANGCVYCHTQQVRPIYQGSDQDRGWGGRRTVARDYMTRRTAFLGTMRTGPDLTNVGLRLNDAAWHHNHLYAPQSVNQYSIMPSYAYLYETRKIKGERSADALDLPEDLAPPEGYEVVPTAEAAALVAYLISLNTDYELPEAK